MASTFSVDGIISGLNTKDIIDQLMSIERRPMDLAQSQLDREDARRKALDGIKSQVTSLQSIVAKLAQRTQINIKSATTDTPPGSPVVLTATAGPDATNGTFAVTVSRLATATRMASGSPIGQVINATAPLANAGFRITPITTVNNSPATFSVNGVTISVDDTTTLDDGSANSIIAKINAAGAGVTASLVADADGRPSNRVQLVSAPGQTVQLGSLSDTSNVLRVLNLTDAAPAGYTAANLTSGAVAAGALNTSITINGVTTTINQTDAGFTSQQNATYIAQQLNLAANATVHAVDNGDGTISLEHNTLGSQQTIDVTQAGAGTGLSVGTTKNGTDRVVSVTNLGVVDTGRPLSSARLTTPIGGLDASGNGAFTINGVSISYRASDSLSDVVNRINASGAGVIATYDTVQDRIRLGAQQTGGQTIGLQDATGNFLAATGLLGASQTVGQHAIFSIDGVNGGQPLTSSSNTVTGYIPGVTLNLRSVSATPVNVTVDQDAPATVSLVKSFVDTFNKTLDAIEAQTKTDPKNPGVLAGDASLESVESSLRSMVTDAAIGASGKYRSLADIGVSTGPTGSAVGTTDRLKLDDAKLTAALKDNPQAVASVLAASLGSAGIPSGVGNVTLVEGSPTAEHEDGTYRVNVTDATTGAVEVRFVTTDGRELMKRTGFLTPNSQNSTLIPGMKLTVGATLTAGEDTFSLSTTNRGVMVRMQDRLDNLLDAGKYFDSRNDASQAISKQLSDQIATMQTRLTDKEAELNRKFTALETAMAQLQSQSNALLSQISKLGSGQ